MPFYHEPIFHDRNSVTNEVPQSTNSSVFVDLVGASITTKDLGEDGNYQSLMPIIVNCTSNNTTISFRVLLDGNPVGSEKHIFVKTKDLDLGYTITSNLGGASLPPNSTIQVQYKTDKGTVEVTGFGIVSDGIPASRVLE